jgi:hypothetical protein
VRAGLNVKLEATAQNAGGRFDTKDQYVTPVVDPALWLPRLPSWC